MQHDPDTVVCLLGKVEQDTFALDYSYPLSAFQAFCIALTSINEKWCFAV
jgi:tubby-related protein 1